MQKVKFGKICASLRQDVFGFDKGSTWSQEDLAEVSSLPTKIIGQIERGEKKKLEEVVLNSLASSFELTTIERERFCHIAYISKDDQVDLDHLDQIIQTVQSLKQPILLHDGLYRIINVNSAFLKIYGLTTDYLDSIPDDDPTKFHIVRHIHDPKSPIREVYKNQIETMELNNLIYWRYFSLAHRHKESFRSIQDTLLKTCPNLGYQWKSLHHQRQGVDITSLKRDYDSFHSDLGNLKYMGITTQLYDKGNELFMASLLPSDANTLQAFNNLLQCENLNIFNWANKHA